MEFKFDIGEEVRDSITGFAGMIMARTQYYTGCNDYGILPKKLTKEGNTRKWEWFDERRLISIKKKMELFTKKPSSGPHPLAPMR